MTKTLGTVLREAREAKSLTLRALANKVGVSAPFWSDVEHGRRYPSDLLVVATVLGIDVAVLKAADERTVKRGEVEDLRARVMRLENIVARMTWKA